MDAGDIYTHAYHAYKSTIIDPDTRTIHPDVLDARRRGVLFDVGHGQGAFSWTVTEICAKEQFWPDIIGTDLHTGSHRGPAYDLPSVMSKFLFLGMPLDKVVKAATSTPAKAIGWGDRIGSLSVGNEADITVLRQKDCDVEVEDCQEQVRRMTTRLLPVAVWRAGKRHVVSCAEPWPRVDPTHSGANKWKLLHIRDPQPPKILQ
jgi:dihydroorotase